MKIDGYDYIDCGWCHVYYPAGELIFTEDSVADYVVYPWMTYSEVRNVKFNE